MNTEIRVPPHAYHICQILEGSGYQTFVVGGCVRDTLLGREPNDWDIATSATPEEVIWAVEHAGYKVIPTGIEHGTVTVVGDRGFLPGAIEVTTFRGDGDYSDGRRPDSVAFVQTIQEDLARRDFTINAMAFRPTTKEFVDPFGGREDVIDRCIRCVGNPAIRFNEDGLRVMRAARFSAQLGFFIAQDTFNAMNGGIPKLEMVARERVTTEFVKLMAGNHVGVGIQALDDSGILKSIFPTLGPPSIFTTSRLNLLGSVWQRIAGLLSPMAAGVNSAPVRRGLEGLRLAAGESREVLALVEGFWSAHRGPREVSACEARAWVSKVGRERYKAILEVVRVFGNAVSFCEAVEAAMETATAIKVGELALNGEQVVEILEVKQGKVVGEALKFLLEKVLEKPELNKTHLLTKTLLTQFAA